MAKQDLIDSLKDAFKRFPKLYYYIIWFLGPILYKDRSYEMLFELTGDDEKIVNIGSGPTHLSKRIVNLDIYPYANVDVLGDAGRLPFKDSSVGGIINIAALEHIGNPQRVIDEMSRILKPGGHIYTVVPFMYGFHASPDDYYRWTKEGIKKLFYNFDEVKFGIHSGPTSALSAILQEWLAMLLSFQNRYIYQILWVIFMVLLSPLKIVDFYLSSHPEAHRVSATIYYICKKPEK